MKKAFLIFISICIIFTSSIPFKAYADNKELNDKKQATIVSEALIKKNYVDKKIFINCNTRKSLNVTVLPKNTTDKAIEWSSSNPKIVSVNSKGVITAHSTGRVTITATAADTGKNKISYDVYGIKKATGNTFSTKNMTIVSTKSAKYTYARLKKDLAKLEAKYSDIMSYTSLGKTYDNRDIYEITLGNPNASGHIFIQSAMHAREYMNCLLTMRQAEAICANYYTGSYQGMSYCELFENICVHIVPMLNPDGVSISQFGASGINNKKLRSNIVKICKKNAKGDPSYYKNWKANARGTDLNKNYPVNWEKNKTGLGKPRSESYKGSSPASEKETVILMKRIEELKPMAVLSYHSTGSYMYWNFFQNGNYRKHCKSLFDAVNSVTRYKDAEPGLKGSYKDLGPNFGSWVCAEQKIPTLTIETGVKRCPLKIGEFKAIWDKNKLVIPAVAYWAINHSD